MLFFALWRGIVHTRLCRSSSDQAMPATSPRRCAVSRRSLNSGPNGHPVSSQACQNQRSSSSLRARSRVRSFVGGEMPLIGDVCSRCLRTAQLNRARRRASVRLAWISAPRSTIASINRIASRTNTGDGTVVPPRQCVCFKIAFGFSVARRSIVAPDVHFQIVAYQHAERVLVGSRNMSACPFLLSGVYSQAHTLKCRSSLAPRLSGLDGWVCTNREAAQPAIEAVECTPALAALGRDTQRQSRERRIEVFDPPARWCLGALHEQIRELACRHHRPRPRVTPG